ncbi:MAG: tRNA (adenosine(37)-N6)-threonylcarbamoyltransferase complex ATPase subunit type 1 TsaE [Desulfofustis sp.]
MAQGAGVDEDECVNSPTFAILHEYRGILPLYHMDFYRLGSSEDVVALGLEEYLYGDGLALIEWYERAEDVMPESALVVLLSHIDETSREILLHSDDPRWLNKINELAATCG